MAKEIWNTYYALFWNKRRAYIGNLFAYDRCPLYLRLILGHLIQFQLEEYLKENIGTEVTYCHAGNGHRKYGCKAVGNPLSVEPYEKQLPKP